MWEAASGMMLTFDYESDLQNLPNVDSTACFIKDAEYVNHNE